MNSYEPTLRVYGRNLQKASYPFVTWVCLVKGSVASKATYNFSISSSWVTDNSLYILLDTTGFEQDSSLMIGCSKPDKPMIVGNNPTFEVTGDFTGTAPVQSSYARYINDSIYISLAITNVIQIVPLSEQLFAVRFDVNRLGIIACKVIN